MKISSTLCPLRLTSTSVFVVACLTALIATAPARAQVRRRHPEAPPAPTAPTAPTAAAPSTNAMAPIPLQPGEPLGNRVAQARAQLDQLEYERVVALLGPLH